MKRLAPDNILRMRSLDVLDDIPPPPRPPSPKCWVEKISRHNRALIEDQRHRASSEDQRNRPSGEDQRALQAYRASSPLREQRETRAMIVAQPPPDLLPPKLTPPVPDTLAFLKAKEDFKEAMNFQGLLYSDFSGLASSIPYFTVV